MARRKSPMPRARDDHRVSQTEPRKQCQPAQAKSMNMGTKRWTLLSSITNFGGFVTSAWDFP
jgi:hypothetical protein